MMDKINQDLINKVKELSALIHKNTMHGGANWIVASPYAESALKEIYKKEEAVKRLKKRIKDVFDGSL
jgi:hypothetical protein